MRWQIPPGGALSSGSQAVQANGGDFGIQLQPFRWAGSQAPPPLASSTSSVTEGGCFNTAPRFSKGKIPKRSRMWSPQQRFSS